MPSAGFAYRVLVVDDEPNVLQVSRLVFEQNDYEVTTAADCFEALAELRRSMPDGRLYVPPPQLFDGVVYTSGKMLPPPSRGWANKAKNVESASGRPLSHRPAFSWKA